MSSDHERTKVYLTPYPLRGRSCYLAQLKTLDETIGGGFVTILNGSHCSVNILSDGAPIMGEIEAFIFGCITQFEASCADESRLSEQRVELLHNVITFANDGFGLV